MAPLPRLHKPAEKGVAPVETFKLSVIELSPIVCNHDSRYSLSANNIFPHKLSNLLGGYLGQWFGLNPLSKIINSYQ